MKYHTIAIDFDDVIVASSPLIISHYNRTYETSMGPDAMYSNDLAQWGVTDDAVAIARVNAYLETAEYRSAPPIQEAVETIQKLAAHYELHIVTGRSKLLEAATHELLDKHFPKLFRSVEFTNFFGETPRSKSDVCKQLGVDLLIDDHLGHALPVAGCGIDVLLFGNYAWNQTKEPLPNNVRRAKDWSTVTEILLP